MKKVFALIASVALIIPNVAFASVMRTDSIGIKENIAENVYVAGSNPVIAGTIQGDLLASGGNIFVSGAVVQDAMFAGGSVNVTGHIGGDLRVFAGNLMLDGPVDGELMVFGGTVIIGPHAIVQGDVNVTGGTVQVDPAAQLLGKKINISNAQDQNKKAPRTFMLDTNRFLSAAFWVTQIMILAGILLVVFIIHLLVPNFTKKLVLGSSTGALFWKSFLIGLVLLVVMPVAAIICFITGVGAILGVLILIAYAGFIIAGMLLAGVVFGGLLYELIKKPKRYAMSWWWIVLGILGLHVVGWVPVLGGLIGFVFFLAAVGAVAKIKWEQRG